MTLTYLMARSAEVAYPRSQVSVNRTIGPLVGFLMHRLISDYFKIVKEVHVLSQSWFCLVHVLVSLCAVSAFMCVLLILVYSGKLR